MDEDIFGIGNVPELFDETPQSKQEEIIGEIATYHDAVKIRAAAVGLVATLAQLYMEILDTHDRKVEIMDSDSIRDIGDAIVKSDIEIIVNERIRKLKTPIIIPPNDNKAFAPTNLLSDNCKHHCPGRSLTLMNLLNPRDLVIDQSVGGLYMINNRTGRFELNPLSENLMEFLNMAIDSGDKKHWAKFLLVRRSMEIILDYYTDWGHEEIQSASCHHAGRLIVADWTSGNTWFPDFEKFRPPNGRSIMDSDVDLRKLYNLEHGMYGDKEAKPSDETIRKACIRTMREKYPDNPEYWTEAKFQEDSGMSINKATQMLYGTGSRKNV